MAFFVTALSALVIFMSTADYFAGPKPFFGVLDDALMLTRYAHNLQTFGKLEWNPAGQPVYGLTSPFYFLSVVMPVAKWVTHRPLAIPLVSSVLSGLLFFALMAFTLLRLLPGPAVFRHVALALAAIAVARSMKDLPVHFVSGMDTLFALFYLTLYIAAARWHALSLTSTSAAIAGICGGLAFGVRPDLLAWTLLVPAAWVLLAPNRREKRLGLVMLLTSVAVLALELGLAAIYFHSPLPLPFYAKSLQLYPELTAGYRAIAVHFLVTFVLTYWLLLLLVVLDIAVDARGWWRETSPLIKGLIAGVAIHTVYFAFLVTQFMPMAQRFYYPSLPAIVFLAACATIRLLSRAPAAWMASLARVPAPYRYAAFAAAILVLPPHVGELNMFAKFAHRNFASLDLTTEYRAYLASNWFGLDRFSTLPSELSMATTEVGHVGAMNLDRTVVDISGLNDPLFVHHKFSADEMFAHYHPDLIYMPHPGYRAMNASLESNPVFQRDYDWIPADKLGDEVMGIALSRSSRHYGEMRRIVSEVCAEQRAGPCKLDR